ncbi:hypothetical protein FOA43_000756 [Brettanomyces nanus]|uniref:LNS2/PITP domain-containing protein n=1 Tax=Eeniella nana TaxID=13502 RepID=A0A875RWW8_EENNA|nr:uncharacterized protein FOA43_000756 [Brettanomyces nanus]QPG73446.1 hypothetical protein FOA43_000756 [Brettanomyces nanus]
MQYVGRAIGSVSKTWSSINPATLSGAIDVIVVEHEDGELYCSPFHVRFGKFQLLRPSQKKVEIKVNGESTDIPMKLGDGGEAFFVFETHAKVPRELQTSPVISPASSPSSSPKGQSSTELSSRDDEPDYLDIGEGAQEAGATDGLTDMIDRMDINSSKNIHKSNTVSSFERAKKLSGKLTKKNIPSTVDANGDVLLDTHGYKSDDKDIHNSDQVVKQLLADEFGPDADLDSLVDRDLHGNIRILSNMVTSDDGMDKDRPTDVITSDNSSEISPSSSASLGEMTSDFEDTDAASNSSHGTGSSGNRAVYFRTLRLTSEQLKCLSLKKGQNTIEYCVNKGKSVITANLYLWKWNVPIVISDIDGTITKSDTLGHFFTMLGKDWTHEGVAKLFSDIGNNGYNIMYLTARSVGLSDMTRSYLTGVFQDRYKLPLGPVVLSPDRTMEALKREIVLKKPQVFKMACLNDIEQLYFPQNTDTAENDAAINSQFGFYGTVESNELDDPPSAFTDIDTSTPDTGTANTEAMTGTDILESARSKTSNISSTSSSNQGKDLKTPFFAGFGNRITDALSYRSVGIPSSRIFTINPDGEVHLELLEMAGYKSSYVSIGELVDQFFPPVSISRRNKGADIVGINNTSNQFSDVNFWRNPVPNLSDLSEDESYSDKGDDPGEKRPETYGRPPSNGDASSIGSMSPRLKSLFGRSEEQEGGNHEDETMKDPKLTEKRNEEEGQGAEEDEEEEDDLDEDPDYIYDDEVDYDDEEGDEETTDVEDEDIPDDDLQNEEESNRRPERKSVGLGLTGDGTSSPASIVVDPTNIEGTFIGPQDKGKGHI